MAHPFVPTPADVYYAQYRHAFGGKVYVMAHYVHHSPSLGENVQDWVDHLSSSYATHFFANANSHYTYLGITVSDSTVQDGPQWTSAVGSSAGIGGNPPVPPEVSLVISVRSADRGRTRRGRMYWPGMPAANYDPNIPGWSASVVSSFSTYLANWRADSESSSVLPIFNPSRWQIASKYPKVGPRLVALMTDVDHLQVNPQPCSQRRRQTQHRGRLR